MNSNRLSWLVTALLALMVAAAALWRLLDQPVAIQERVAACSPAPGPCSLQLPDGAKVTLSISPSPPKPLSPLMVELQAEGGVEVPTGLVVEGVEMDMGRLTVPLMPVGDGVVSGRLVLPVCTLGEMVWAVKVAVGDGEYAAFRFVALR